MLVPVVLVALFQVLPLFRLTWMNSPVTVPALKVPVIVWAAVLVLKSVALLPVSALRLTVLTVMLGAVVSKTYACVLTALTLPAASETLTCRVLLAVSVAA